MGKQSELINHWFTLCTRSHVGVAEKYHNTAYIGRYAGNADITM